MESQEETKQMPREMYNALLKYIDFDSVKKGVEKETSLEFDTHTVMLKYTGGDNYVLMNGIKYKLDWPKISDIKPINLYKDTLFGPLRDLETGDTLEIKSKTTNMTFIRNEYGLFKLLPSGRHQIVILNYSDRED